VAERGIFDPWNINIQDLPQFVAGGCLTCGGVSNEMAKKSHAITFWDNVVEEVMNFYFVLSRMSFIDNEEGPAAYSKIKSVFSAVEAVYI
jgi:hypothetical protein